MVLAVTAATTGPIGPERKQESCLRIAPQRLRASETSRRGSILELASIEGYDQVETCALVNVTRLPGQSALAKKSPGHG